MTGVVKPYQVPHVDALTPMTNTDYFVCQKKREKEKYISMFTFKCSTAFDFASLPLHSCGCTVVTGVTLYTPSLQVKLYAFD